LPGLKVLGQCDDAYDYKGCDYDGGNDDGDKEHVDQPVLMHRAWRCAEVGDLEGGAGFEFSLDIHNPPAGPAWARSESC
jgi:hypothetical protein